MEKAVEAERAASDGEKDVEMMSTKEIYGPHPSLALVKFWQGIVELCIRISIVVLSFVLLVAACVSVSDVSIDTTGTSSDVMEMVDDGRSVSGFMVFVSLLTLLGEVALIIVRFLNFGAINRFFLLFVILELVAITIVGIFSFSGGVAAAVAGEEWQEQIDSWERQGVRIHGRGHRIPRNLRATAAFGILTTLALIVLGVWMVLYLVFDWNKHMTTQEKEIKTVLK